MCYIQPLYVSCLREGGGEIGMMNGWIIGIIGGGSSLDAQAPWKLRAELQLSGILLTPIFFKTSNKMET